MTRKRSNRWLHSISSWVSAVFQLSIKHPRFTILFYVFCLIIAAIGFKNLQFVLTVDDLKDPDFPSLSHLQQVKERFHPGHAVILVFSMKKQTPLRSQDLCAIKDWIHQEESNNKEIELIISGFDPLVAFETGDKVEYRKLLSNICTDEGRSLAPLNVFKGSPWENIVGASNGATFNVSMQFRDTPGQTIYGVFDPFPVREMFERAQLHFLGLNENWQLHLVGTGSFRLYLAEALQSDQWLNILFTLILVLLFRFFLGSWMGGILIILNITMVSIILIGTMSWFGVNFDMISNSLIIIVMIAAIQDFLFISQHQIRRQCDFRKTFRVFLLPGFFTSLTTIVGFGSLATSSFNPIQDFGVWAAFGALVEWMITFSFLPALLKQFKKLRVWTNPDRALGVKICSKISKFEISPFVLKASMLLLFVSIPTVFFVSPADEPNDYLSPSHPFNLGVEKLVSTHGWDARLYVAFKDKFLKSENTKVANEIRKWENIVAIEDPYDVQHFVENNQRESVRNMVSSDFAGAPVYTHYFSDDNWALLRVYLRNTSTQAIDDFVTQLKSLCPDKRCFVADTLVAFTEISHQLISTMLKSFLISLLLVSFVIIMVARTYRMKNTSRLLISAFWGIGFVFLFISLLNINVNYVTVVFAAVLVGIAGDNAIHYLFAGRFHPFMEGTELRGSGSIQIYITCALTCSVFLFSTLHSPKILGVLFFVGFIGSLYGDLWVLKALEKRATVR